MCHRPIVNIELIMGNPTCNLGLGPTLELPVTYEIK